MTFEIVNADGLKIISDIEPKPHYRMVTPYTPESEVKNILRKPFAVGHSVTVTVETPEEEYKLFFSKDYTWDGASVPPIVRLLLKKGDPRYLLASMLHDKVCECPWLIDYNLKLSTDIFKHTAISCKTNKAVANIMAFFIDKYQRRFTKWQKS